jgi:hypothetical protein
MDGEWLGTQQCLYLRPLPQGQGSFLPIFSRAWRGISCDITARSLWKARGVPQPVAARRQDAVDTGWISLREENCRFTGAVAGK